MDFLLSALFQAPDCLGSAESPELRINLNCPEENCATASEAVGSLQEGVPSLRPSHGAQAPCRHWASQCFGTQRYAIGFQLLDHLFIVRISFWRKYCADGQSDLWHWHDIEVGFPHWKWKQAKFRTPSKQNNNKKQKQQIKIGLVTGPPPH